MPNASPAATALADRLDRERSHIVERWMASVRAAYPHGRELSTPELIDSLPDLLEWIAEALRRGQRQHDVDEGSPGAAVARQHGLQRFRHGFDLIAVVREYAILREILFDFAEAEGLAEIEVIRLIAHQMGTAIAAAVEQFSAEREADFHRAHAEVEKAREHEQQLIGVVSHDLRNPLSVISMCLELALASKGLGDVATRALRRAESSAREATRLIGDLLDFTLERRSGKLPIHPTAADLGEIAQEAIEAALFQYPTRSIDYAESGSLEGHWDADRIGQLVGNLLSNALKFSPAGTPVRVMARATAEGVCLEVHNWGPAIAEERLSTVFEAFARADPTTDARVSLGLGLHIARQIVLAHGGRVVCRSTEAEGTTFTVDLPRRCPEP